MHLPSLASILATIVGTFKNYVLMMNGGREREGETGGSLFLSFVASSRAYPNGLPKRRHLCISSAKLIDLFRTSTVHSIWTDRTVALFFKS